jgi:hypothetical protein
MSDKSPTHRWNLSRAWELQDPEHRPTHLTAEEKAYCEEYDRRETEAAKWDVPLPEERRLRWGNLSKAGKWEELEADQAELFESWLRDNPERVRDLLPHVGTRADPPDGTGLPLGAYHSSGLFWIAANVLFKMYGFDDRLADSIVRGLLTKWSQTRYGVDAVTMGCSFGYTDTIRKLATKGAHSIRNIDHYLLRTVRNAILKESGYDRHRQERTQPGQPLFCPACGESEITPPAVCPNCHCGVPKLKDTEYREESIYDLSEEASLAGSRACWPDTELSFLGVSSIPS